jgi:hypothetical protein
VAGNLGHDAFLFLDAKHTYDRVVPDGLVVSAEKIARASEA